MYKTITNPKTGKIHDIKSKIGKRLIKKYSSPEVKRGRATFPRMSYGGSGIILSETAEQALNGIESWDQLKSERAKVGNAAGRSCNPVWTTEPFADTSFDPNYRPTTQGGLFAPSEIDKINSYDQSAHTPQGSLFAGRLGAPTDYLYDGATNTWNPPLTPSNP